MRRTQLYLDDDLWTLLHMLARQSGGTISELVRTAIREKYSQDRARRKEACEAIVGLWKDRTDIGETEDYVRDLRRSSRLERLAE
jgi:metal-responsive CopG/Arc/MetJ family transcriptional regulator